MLWPQLTRHTSKPLCKNITITHTLRTLLPMLGGEILDRNRGRRSDFTCIGTNSAVQIGMWKFTTGNRETSQLDRKSCSSWFCMPLKNVKQVAWMHRGKPEHSWDAASMVYGQFHHFLRVSVPKWNDGDREHLLGRCTLARSETPLQGRVHRNSCETQMEGQGGCGARRQVRSSQLDRDADRTGAATGGMENGRGARGTGTHHRRAGAILRYASLQMISFPFLPSFMTFMVIYDFYDFHDISCLHHCLLFTSYCPLLASVYHLYTNKSIQSLLTAGVVRPTNMQRVSLNVKRTFQCCTTIHTDEYRKTRH